ncbi:GNAT family N-acetyltransferase [Cellulomonas sp. DKR-3]|uniref:GNAT family N-acetyltransferase n=1 Tax=Cellulomonas fulva TaxID=2835530 RepID=A0ABS5TX68_9CELL|nr:GNAT family N-acetyltransferase [Cellulomonas fulva]MBT0993725.1 GNAT family N-acetyltransferase [Cellulomonas fulva]
MSHFAPYAPDEHGRPDPALVVRPAEPEDVAGVARVARTRGATQVGLEGRLAGWLRSDLHVVLAARRDDEVVGWASARVLGGHADSPDGWYVSSLTVDPAWRRRGAGDRLLAAVVAAVAARVTAAGDRTDALRSIVNATNHPSLDLHAAHGFVEEARGPSFAGVTFTGGVGVLLARPLP